MKFLTSVFILCVVPQGILFGVLIISRLFIKVILLVLILLITLIRSFMAILKTLFPLIIVNVIILLKCMVVLLVTRSMSTMACNKPFALKDKNGNIVPVPCGFCMQCRIDKRNEWTMRIDSEVSARGGAFVTLTYDDLHLPDDLGLHKDDLQKFLKRFRKFYPPRQISYYAVGEYGSQGNIVTGLRRPHFHLIIIGDTPLRMRSNVSSAWTFGFNVVKGAEKGSIRYVLKYMDKQLHGADALRAEYGDKQPPFALMSKGLGISFMSKNLDTVQYYGAIPFNGRLMPIPRYYKDRFELSNHFDKNKHKVVKDYAGRYNVTYVKALNDLGSANEQMLESAELMFRH